MLITISPSNEEIKSIIGTQSYLPWKNYKKSIYVLEKEIEEGTLYYNLFTREVIIVSGEEEISKMVQKWFYVPDDVDEKSLVYSFWQSYYTKNPRRPKRLKLAVVFTTTDCNARCPYCYEYGTSKNTMSAETAEKAAEYILNKSGDKIHIKWFGGEPLVNTEAIDIISERLQESGIEYSSRIVSNAYLFDQVPDDTLLNLWKLNYVQITIDGTKKQYERIKGLPEGAFEKVLDTIERLAKLGITVSVRIHVSPDNGDDLKQLIMELTERYEDIGDAKKKIRPYVAPLFETFGETITDDERKRMYDSLIELDKLIMQTGFPYNCNIPKIKGSHCMADNGSSIVIAPTGDLTPCEHYHDDEIVGNIETGGRIPAYWHERTPEVPECRECFYYPQCVKLKMCNAEPPCNDQNRRYMRYQAERAMMRVYEQYKATGKINNQTESRSGGERRIVKGTRNSPRRNRLPRRG